MSKTHQRRQSRLPANGVTDPAPSFTPVPVRARKDGWTPGKQIALIRALAACGCVAEACRHVGMSKQSAYDLYNRPDAVSLRQAWDAAQTQSATRLADAVIGRALNGVATPIFFHGEQIGERVRYDDRLAMWLLRHLLPERFGAWRDQHVFRRKHPDGIAQTLAYALRGLAEDMVADRAGTPRPHRQAAAFTRFDDADDTERDDRQDGFIDKLRRSMEEDAFQEHLARIKRGEARSEEVDGDVP